MSKAALKNKRKRESKQRSKQHEVERGHSEEQRDAISITSHLVGEGASRGQGSANVDVQQSETESEKEKKLKNLKKVSVLCKTKLLLGVLGTK